MLFHPWRDESKLMGSESTYENQYKRIETDISKIRTLFESTAEEIQEAMNAVREEQVDDELDEIAPNSRQTEEDAELAKENQISILQPPNERSRFYDIGLEF
ncbi:hypothetical protein DPMN_169660 [Dreissena polymorpha]|uniref:Uncharacterized protein n=1 Tax=Dreissena polymorpha TaxID=45954 RepID=A0A9D4DWF6_DREPO|nr:hypothetical protein DPMN_169660 [Dreissena polymorpha]